MRSGEPHLVRVRALDGVRGIAVAAVLLFHSDLLRGGYLGVDLFFVLSGYLITNLLLVEGGGSGTIALGRFWARRARRLLPALLLVICATVLYAALVAAPTELGRIRGDVFATLGYVANWRLIADRLDYWSLFQSKSPLLHTWSLAIEEQFYLVWPLVVLAAARVRGARRGSTVLARRVLALAVLGAAVGAAWSLALWLRTGDDTRVYFGTDTRVSAVLLGAALAAVTAWRGPVAVGAPRRRLEVAGWCAVALLAVAWTRLEGPALYQGGLIVCGLAAALVVAAAAHPRPGPLSRVLAVPPLVGLGIISYGLYLWHWPIYLVLDQRRTGLDGWSLFALRASVTFVVALVSYRFVERPIRTGALARPAARRLVPIAIAVALGTTMIATAGATDLGPDRFVAPNARRLRRVAAVRRTSRIMFGGNSVANVLAAEGVVPQEGARRLTVLNDGVFSCDFPAAPEQTTDFEPVPRRPVDCTSPWSAAHRFDPEYVVLMFADVHTTRFHFADGWTTQCEPAYARHYVAALDGAVRQLGSHGARVVLTTSPYSLLVLPADYTARVRRATDCNNALVRSYAAAHRSVRLVDLGGFVCPQGVCRRSIDGNVLRPDGIHYRGGGALIVASWLLDQLGLPVRASTS